MHLDRRTPKRLLIIAFGLLLAAAGTVEARAGDDRYQNGLSQTYPPGILHSTLLDNITVNANGGWIKVGTNLVAVFLPENAEGRMVLNDASGREICHWDWAASRGGFNAPFQTINFRNAMAPSGSQFDMSELKLTKPGRYIFDFHTSGKRFYTFPVSIHEVQPSNPFAGEPRYLVDGDWNSWGYLYVPDVTPDSNVAWKLWLREWEYDLKTRSISVELVRDSDKAVIAQNRRMTSVTFRHDWKRHDYQLYKPKDRSLFKGKDLLKKDGKYTLTMRMNDEVYGIWKFEVKDGKMTTSGRSARGTAAPKTFVEGGLDAFWYESEGR